MPYASVEERAANLTATEFLVLGDLPLVEADKSKLRVDVVDQQVDKVGKTFLGMTLACARCHDHKFDPISQRDYYAMAGFFFSTSTVYRANYPGVWSEVHDLELPETEAQKVQRVQQEQLQAQKITDRKQERSQAVDRKEELEALLKGDNEADQAGDSKEEVDAVARLNRISRTKQRDELTKELEKLNGQIGILDHLIAHAEIFLRPRFRRSTESENWRSPYRLATVWASFWQ